MIVRKFYDGSRTIEARDETDLLQQLMDMHEFTLYRRPNGSWKADYVGYALPLSVGEGTREQCAKAILHYLDHGSLWRDPSKPKPEPPPPSLIERLEMFIDDVLGKFGLDHATRFLRSRGISPPIYNPARLPGAVKDAVKRLTRS